VNHILDATSEDEIIFFYGILRLNQSLTQSVRFRASLLTLHNSQLGAYNVTTPLDTFTCMKSTDPGAKLQKSSGTLSSIPPSTSFPPFSFPGGKEVPEHPSGTFRLN
jgi:hypothetical protein